MVTAKRIYRAAGVVTLWGAVAVNTASDHPWLAAFNPKRWIIALFGH